MGVGSLSAKMGPTFGTQLKIHFTSFVCLHSKYKSETC